MYFISKNPLVAPKIDSSPPAPLEGMRGMFAGKDGWYEIDDNGAVKKIGSDSDALDRIQHYGDVDILPSDESLFSFTPDDETMTVSVKGRAGNIVFGDVVVPYKYTSNGKTYMVTSISYNAFNNKDSITNLIIPNSVKTIEANAFIYCNGITSITIPKSVTSIGNYAFLQCSALADIYYDGSEEDWSKITLGSQAIPGHAKIHYNWTSTTQGYVDEKIAEVKEGVDGIEAKVNAMSGLNSLIYYGNANIVPSNADIFSLTVLNEANGTGYLYPLDFPGNLSGEIVLPYEFEFEGKVYKNVELGENSFAYAACDSLIIPSSVKVIKPVSFWQAQIKEITFCGDTFEIQEEAFMDCTTLTDVYYKGSQSDWNEKVTGKENLPENTTVHFVGEVTYEYLGEEIGDIDAALEEIVAIQEELMTPDGNEVDY